MTFLQFCDIFSWHCRNIVKSVEFFISSIGEGPSLKDPSSRVRAEKRDGLHELWCRSWSDSVLSHFWLHSQVEVFFAFIGKQVSVNVLRFI